MDEVGRGALAGPVTVGVVVVDAAARSAPTGVRDSKLLTPAARVSLVPKLRRWAVCSAVGHAEPEEIDSYGIIAALRLAGRRALAQLTVAPTCVLLDGSHDWLTVPAEPAGLFELDLPGRRPAPTVTLAVDPIVVTQVKADLRCAAVAAASVLAKVERDAIMVGRAVEFPEYCWHENKGYSAPEHGAALRRLGPCLQHRRTWSLPVVETLAAEELTGEEPAGETLEAETLEAGTLEAEVETLAAEDLAAEESAAETWAAEELAGDEPAAFAEPMPDEPDDLPAEVLDLVEVGIGAAAADPGRHADGALALRHDGSVAR